MPAEPQSPPIPCLIQLNGDNVAANLLPIMALRPERIVQLVTKSQRAERAVARFKEVFSLLAKEQGFEGYRPRIHDQTISQSGLADVRDTIAKLLLENPGAVVNFSGGTKLMSLGAYQAALALGRPSLYCDVEEGNLVDGATAPLATLANYRDLAGRLSIGMLLALNSRALNDMSHEVPSDKLRSFGLRAYELRLQQGSALEGFNKTLRSALYGPADKLPDSADELSGLLAKPLPSVISSSEPSRHYLAAAVTAGLLKATGDQYRLAASATKDEIAKVCRVLAVGWLELAVVDRMIQNPAFRDVLWNVRLSSTADTAGGILCLDAKQMTLRFIDCLPALSRSPQDHVESILERARRVGGESAEPVLVLLRGSQGGDAALKHAAKRAGVTLILGPEEIVNAFAKSN